MKIGALVVTYNRLQILKEVVQSLRDQTYSDMQIIVVNNGSTDGTGQWLAEQTDVVTITQGNLGGAGGFSTGMNYIACHDFDACWLMDDDVVCRPTALEELVKGYEIVGPKAGFLCSMVVGLQGQPMNVPVVDQRKIADGYPDWMQYLDRMIVKVEASTFVSVFVPTRIIREMGLPHKEYFIWCDDMEYTMRITRKHPAYMVCNSVVVHKRAAQNNLSFESETDKRRIRMFFYYFRNETHVKLKYGTMFDVLKRLVIVSVKSVKSLLRGDFLKSYVAMRSQLSFLFFRPKIEYPSPHKKINIEKPR